MRLSLLTTLCELWLNSIQNMHLLHTTLQGAWPTTNKNAAIYCFSKCSQRAQALSILRWIKEKILWFSVNTMNTIWNYFIRQYKVRGSQQTRMLPCIVFKNARKEHRLYLSCGSSVLDRYTNRNFYSQGLWCILASTRWSMEQIAN